jgi:hypothetical protein
MTFPLTLGPGQEGYLASPDLGNYYMWEGKATSAHYYINDQGISEDDACTWAKDGDARGNWAPVIFGTSFDGKSQKGYSSLKQNELNRKTKLNYSISFEGDGVVSPCSYKKSTDQYCQGDSCWTVKDDPNRGCTVSHPFTSMIIELTLNSYRLVARLAAPSLWSSLTSPGARDRGSRPETLFISLLCSFFLRQTSSLGYPTYKLHGLYSRHVEDTQFSNI